MVSKHIRILLLFSLFVNVLAQKYKGCYEDSLRKPVFNGLGQNGPHMDGQLSTSSCSAYCSARDFPYMAVQEGLLCFCSRVLPSKGPVDDKLCDVACSGNTIEICGGIGYISAYTTTSFLEQEGPNVSDAYDQSFGNPNALSIDRQMSPFSVGMYCIIGTIVVAFVVLFVYILKTLLKAPNEVDEEKFDAKHASSNPWSMTNFLCYNK